MFAFRRGFVALLAIAAILTIAALFILGKLDTADAAGWSGCGAGVGGSYNSAVVEDTLGAEGPGLHVTALCDMQSGRAVFGVWGEYSWRRFEFGPGSTIDVDVDGWAAGGRAGYLVTERALVYLTAGYTDLEVSAMGGSIDADGWLVGGGGEYDLGSGFFLRGEYRYTMLDPDLGGPEIDANVHSGLASVIWKFGPNPVADAFEGKPLK